MPREPRYLSPLVHLPVDSPGLTSGEPKYLSPTVQARRPREPKYLSPAVQSAPVNRSTCPRRFSRADAGADAGVHIGRLYHGTVTHRGRRSIRRLLASLLAALLTGGAGLVATAPAPAYAEDTVQLSLSLDSVTISGTKPKDKVVLKLTLRNTGTVTAYGVLAYLWRSHDPIRDRATLASVAGGASPWGERLRRPGSWLLVAGSTTAFEPGAMRAITLSASLADLGFTARTAAYAVGADVVANADQSSKADLAAQVRTFVPMPGKAKVPVTSIVLLSAPPTKLFDNLFADEDLTAELTGRLNTLLQAAGSGHSWLIDPALLDEVRDQADGYQVVAGTGTKPGAGQQVAADWLARFQLLDRSRGGRVLFGSPDTAGAEDAGAEIVQWSTDASANVDGISDLPLIAIPTGGVATTSQLDFLGGAGAQAILAANTVSGAPVQNGGSSTRILATSPTVPSLVPADPTAAVEQQQLALAELAVAGTRGQARLLTTAADLTQDTATRPSWTTSRDLDDVLDAEPSTKANLSTSKPALLAPSQFTAIDRLKDDFAFYSQLVPGSAFVGEPDEALVRAASSAWITDPRGGRAYVDALRKLIGRDTINDGVRLDASGRFVMSARSNQFPITVTNELSEAVTVRVEVTTTNPQRLSVPTTDPITIAPGQSETVNIRPEASGNGLISGTAHAVTIGGKKVGRDIQVTFEVTELGFVAWIIVGVSAVVLVATTALRIRQVRRRDAAAASQQANPKAAQ